MREIRNIVILALAYRLNPAFRTMACGTSAWDTGLTVFRHRWSGSERRNDTARPSEPDPKLS